MALGLGIDTGGTYTDGVLYDMTRKSIVATAKRLTTHGQLSRGICAALDAFDRELLSEVRLVSLSTTLATNACVEGRGSRAALILMGYDPAALSQLSGEYGLANAEVLTIVKGRHTQRGMIECRPDYGEIDGVLASIEGRVDAIGISEYWGVKNPEFEKEVKEYVRAATGLPVAAAHELTSEINSMRRAATTLINARLISLTDEMLRAVRTSLDERGISAPLMIVRGDGSMMTERFARECPVETMLSGPAASVSGAMHLSGVSDMIVADTGGTTTDLSVVRRGRVKLVDDGVNVGEWRTGTRAIDIHTLALGGDTEVRWISKDGLSLGASRAIPLSALSASYTGIKEKLAELISGDKYATYSRGVFLALNREPPKGFEMNGEERAIYAALSVNSPLTIEELAEIMRSLPYIIRYERLVSAGIIIKSTLTPTDILHINGEFTAFDVEAARLGAALLARQTDMAESALCDKIIDLAGARAHMNIAELLISRALKRPRPERQTVALGYSPVGDELNIMYNSSLPIVGIGAPARSLLSRAAGRLGAELILPEGYEVANAVGAICGNIVAEECAVIDPIHDALGVRGYSVHLSSGHFSSESLTECEEWAAGAARETAIERAGLMGAFDIEVELVSEEQSGYAAGENRQHFLIRKRVIARATGRA